MGIIAQWSDFTAEEDENDQIVDLTGNGNTGILHDDVSVDLIGARGRILNFSGSPANVRVPDSATVSPTTALSVGAWVFKTDTDRAMIVDKDQTYRLWIPLDDNVPCFNVYCSGAWYEFQGTFSIPTNQWVFLQGGYDSATKTVQLYLQGSLKTEDTNFDHGVVNDNSLQVYFGMYSPGGYQFGGYIGEVLLRDNLIDLAIHRADLKRWLKRRAGRVIEFLELHIGGDVEPILITTQPEEVTATVYDVLGVTATTTTTTTTTSSTTSSTSSTSSTASTTSSTSSTSSTTS